VPSRCAKRTTSCSARRKSSASTSRPARSAQPRGQPTAQEVDEGQDRRRLRRRGWHCPPDESLAAIDSIEVDGDDDGDAEPVGAAEDGDTRSRRLKKPTTERRKRRYRQTVIDINEFDAIRIGLAVRRSRSATGRSGEVTKPETINYRTLKPERDGLFCERIFRSDEGLGVLSRPSTSASGTRASSVSAAASR